MLLRISQGFVVKTTTPAGPRPLTSGYHLDRLYSWNIQAA
jgi:hypothetical protein